MLKCSIITYRKSTTLLPTTYIWSIYVSSKPPPPKKKGGGSKIPLRNFANRSNCVSHGLSAIAERLVLKASLNGVTPEFWNTSFTRLHVLSVKAQNRTDKHLLYTHTNTQQAIFLFNWLIFSSPNVLQTNRRILKTSKKNRFRSLHYQQTQNSSLSVTS